MTTKRRLRRQPPSIATPLRVAFPPYFSDITHCSRVCEYCEQPMRFGERIHGFVSEGGVEHLFCSSDCRRGYQFESDFNDHEFNR